MECQTHPARMRRVMVHVSQRDQPACLPPWLLQVVPTCTCLGWQAGRLRVHFMQIPSCCVHQTCQLVFKSSCFVTHAL